MSITKRGFFKKVHNKFTRVIHYLEVFSVLGVLIEEMIKMLLEGKEIKINNFGTFSLRKMPAKKYHDVRLKKVVLSKPRNSLHFSLAPKFKKKLCEAVDIDKSCGKG